MAEEDLQPLLREMHSWMDQYMKSFHTDDEEVMVGISIKEVHTGYVTSIARELAKHLELNAHDVQLAEKGRELGAEAIERLIGGESMDKIMSRYNVKQHPVKENKE